MEQVENFISISCSSCIYHNESMYAVLQVVPPDQARKIYQALKAKGLPVALVEYEGEQHGFRKAENIKFTLEQQMVFFARLVGHFKVADEIVPIKIDNFD
ncbi:putative peptidase S9, prolyl oligopeptidase, catalytic domain, alpha/Beta hydrolase [Helianthus annuus]|nr:putative peptidase S9, prolyl oligopeptidase, catalytic domain, alpha/Beta hydrolase [Helianthus annuus]